MREALKWSFIIVVAMVITAIPTSISSHHVTVGFPFTWYSRQEIVTVGTQPHMLSPLWLFLDFGAAALALALAVELVRAKRK